MLFHAAQIVNTEQLLLELLFLFTSLLMKFWHKIHEANYTGGKELIIIIIIMRIRGIVPEKHNNKVP
jgi:hypothetical protein